MRLDRFVQEEQQLGEQAEPPHECVFRNGERLFVAGDAGDAALGRVNPAE